jgi:hypothetical protein
VRAVEPAPTGAPHRAAYGASTIAGADGSRIPSFVELEGAAYQGRHVAQIAARLARS